MSASGAVFIGREPVVKKLRTLTLPVDASAGLTLNNIGQVQGALIKWIETNAARVPVVPHHNQRADLPLTKRRIPPMAFRSDSYCAGHRFT